LVQILLFLYISNTVSAKQPDQQITKPSIRILLVSFLTIAILSLIIYIPLLGPILRDLAGRGRSDFNPFFPWTVIQTLTGSESKGMAVLLIVVSALGWFSLLKSNRLEGRYFIWLLIGPLLIMWIARPFDLYPRFFAYWLPYYLLFFILGLRSLWQFAPRGNVWLVSSRMLSGLILIVVLHNWSANWRNYIPNEGYREASIAIARDADDSVAFCAIGGARSVWQYYINRPILTPLSVADLQKLSSNHAELRCVYYEATWQSFEQTEIASYLSQHASWQRVKGFTLFRYRS